VLVRYRRLRLAHAGAQDCLRHSGDTVIAIAASKWRCKAGGASLASSHECGGALNAARERLCVLQWSASIAICISSHHTPLEGRGSAAASAPAHMCARTVLAHAGAQNSLKDWLSADDLLLVGNHIRLGSRRCARTAFQDPNRLWPLRKFTSNLLRKLHTSPGIKACTSALKALLCIVRAMHLRITRRDTIQCRIDIDSHGWWPAR
jgi:hypothetical protein